MGVLRQPGLPIPQFVLPLYAVCVDLRFRFTPSRTPGITTQFHMPSVFGFSCVSVMA